MIVFEFVSDSIKRVYFQAVSAIFHMARAKLDWFSHLRLLGAGRTADIRTL